MFRFDSSNELRRSPALRPGSPAPRHSGSVLPAQGWNHEYQDRISRSLCTGGCFPRRNGRRTPRPGARRFQPTARRALRARTRASESGAHAAMAAPRQAFSSLVPAFLDTRQPLHSLVEGVPRLRKADGAAAESVFRATPLPRSIPVSAGSHSEPPVAGPGTARPRQRGRRFSIQRVCGTKPPGASLWLTVVNH